MTSVGLSFSAKHFRSLQELDPCPRPLLPLLRFCYSAKALLSPFPSEAGCDFLLSSQFLAGGPAVTGPITWNGAWFWVLSPGLLPELCSAGREDSLRYPNGLAQSELVMPFDRRALACLAASWGWASFWRQALAPVPRWILATSPFPWPVLMWSQPVRHPDVSSERGGGRQRPREALVPSLS